MNVVQVDVAPDNAVQLIGQDLPRLPFRRAAFHLVVNRHESFVAADVARILDHGGHFITQQLGDGVYANFRALFHQSSVEDKLLTLPMAVAQLEAAGLRVDESGVGRESVRFDDVGALAWYLRMIPWTVPGFSITEQREQLEKIHRRMRDDGPLVLDMPGFYLVAVKAGSH